MRLVFFGGRHQNLEEKGDGKREMGKGRWEKGDGKREMRRGRWEKGDGKREMGKGRWEIVA
ncbi:hypothetical protein [Myroides sp. C15-4]|uniref:hypothetical protein n=1 Tax=Myroides sp. C15-4 TaxID=3400532 RepID=UPI003D2F72AD